MRECTNTSKADKKAILERMRAGKTDSDGARVTKPGDRSPEGVESVGGSREDWCRPVRGHYPRDRPWDDPIRAVGLRRQNLRGRVPRLYDMLERLAPRSWDVRKLTRHQVWEGFGKVPVLLNWHIVVPELVLRTPSGLFLLTR
jgi:hypothetical protein